MKYLIENPEHIMTVFFLLSVATPVILMVIRWYWKKTRVDVEKSISTALSDGFKKMLEAENKYKEDQFKILKDQNTNTERAVELMKQDSERSYIINERTLSLMEMYIEEIGVHRKILDDHEERIIIIEKIKT